MFSPRKKPLLLVADRLLSLRPSLNTPVVSTPELSAGPARAAIAVHSEAGRPRFVVAVRSLRTGASVVYELEGEDLDGASGHAVALDAALSFGESMGFLFDDEMITQRKPGALRKALGRLREIVASPEPDEEELGAAGGDDGEILLEEPAEPSPEAPVRKAAAAPPPPEPAATLTKFRKATPTPDAEPDPEPARPAARGGRKGAATLGRVRPVRLRGAPSDGPPPAHPLFRLLSAF
jgi:hypothetical protein